MLAQSDDIVVSLELNQKSVEKAVGFYIKDKLNKLASDWGDMEGDNPARSKTTNRQALEGEIQTKAEGTFLRVALVFEELRETCSTAREAIARVKEQVPGVFGRYREILLLMLRDRRVSSKCAKALLVLANAYRPPTLSELHVLADLDEAQLLQKISCSCRLLTIIPGKKTVHFVHQSAKDLLTLDAASEGNEEWRDFLHRVFYKGHMYSHQRIITRSLSALKQLKRDIYGLEHTNPGISLEEAAKCKPDPDPLEGLDYSVSYWMTHLIAACQDVPGAQEKLLSKDGDVRQFLESRLLY